MNLFIKIDENKNIIGHPILEENLLMVEPYLNVENLPPNYAKFKRIERPVTDGPYYVYERVRYEWEDDFVKDVHIIREMTSEEKKSLQDKVKYNWLTTTNLKSWVFDEVTCSFKPPIDYPDKNDNKNYVWDEDTVSWKEVV